MFAIISVHYPMSTHYNTINIHRKSGITKNPRAINISFIIVSFLCVYVLSTTVRDVNVLFKMSIKNSIDRYLRHTIWIIMRNFIVSFIKKERKNKGFTLQRCKVWLFTSGAQIKAQHKRSELLPCNHGTNLKKILCKLEREGEKKNYLK